MYILRRCLTLVSAFACACGDPAPPSAFKGEPLLTIDCVVAAEDSGAPLRIALLWQSPEGGYAANVDGSAEVSFPANAEVQVFTPPDAALLQHRDDATGGIAIGEIVVFEDLDDDQHWSAAEPIVGISYHLVIFAPEPVLGSATGALTAGFHQRSAGSCLDTSQALLEPPRSCTVTVSPKFTEPFDYACDVSAWACLDLAPVRRTCHADPGAAICDVCAAGVFPPDATPDACRAWFEGCVAAFPDASCGSESKICTSGEDPVDDPNACTGQCECDRGYDECIAAGVDAAACASKRANCNDFWRNR